MFITLFCVDIHFEVYEVVLRIVFFQLKCVVYDTQVYAGSVSPSVTFAAWEGMGLEERLSAVLAASSAETIAADVRNFARATITSVHDVEG